MSNVASPPLPHVRTSTGQASFTLGEGSICRVELTVDVEPLTWLASRSEGELCYWASRNGQEETAAAGVLINVSGSAASGTTTWMERITTHLNAADEGVRFYGGTRFDMRTPAAPEWRTLGAYRFVVPRFEAVRRDGRTLLVCNFWHSERDGLSPLLADLQRPPAPVPERPPLVCLQRHADTPTHSEWEELVRTALVAIDNPRDPLRKVVVARRTSATAASLLTPSLLLACMSRTEDRSFRFLVQPRPGTAFVSVTPERLFSLSGRTVHTEAIAGTRRRGYSKQEDQRLRQELSSSAKDVLEHRIVHDAIASALSNLCTDTKASTTKVLRLPAVQHLMSRLSGHLAPGLGVADLIDSLHPTPAVGGEPAEPARCFLTLHETFDRGWYAAPVGWIGQGEATFAVAIRSALLNGEEVSLYTGNGVVTGSSPDSEWAELEAKVGCYFAPGS